MPIPYIPRDEAGQGMAERAGLAFACIVGSAVFYLLLARLQDWVFPNVQFIRGVGWIYLPAGARLLCPLLLGLPGAVGVLVGSWCECFFHLYPDDPLRSFAGGISSALAPYLVYLFALQVLGMKASLANLTSRRLLLLVPLFGVASPLMHHLWFWIHHDPVDLAQGFAVMAAGDMLGAMVVLYALKGMLNLLPAPSRRP
ncbi:hypothetical protein [Massilia putida]|uniref:hypothetical protein n=1 Tax=Massilia putida TaxID=1141883 RepID=UPI000B00CA25|nr:hypothetical protein [Massilia putida]